jgi:ATP-binding cassette subfamily B protein
VIRQLLSVLDPETVRNYRNQIRRSVIYAALEGIAVGLTLPALAAFIGNDDSVVGWLIALAAVTTAALAANAWVTQRGTRATFDAMESVQRQEIDKIRSLPLDWFTPRRNAALLTLLWPGAISTTRNILLNLASLARGVITPLIVLVIAAFVSPWAAMTMVIATPVLYIVHRVTTRTLEASEQADHEANTEATARIIEYAESQQTLRSANRDTLGKKLLTDALDDLDRSASRGVTAEIAARGAFGTAVNLAVTAMVAVVGIALADNPTDVGVLIALLTMSMRFAEPVMNIATTARMLRTSRATVTRTVEFLETAPLPELADPRRLPARPGLAVEFEDVEFSYPGATTPALAGVTVAARPGETVAIVGASGAGKSSLLRLIPRFADPTSGTVRIAGIDVRELELFDLYHHVGLAISEVVLLDRSLRENVLAGSRDITQEDLDRAAKISGLDEVLRRLPAGWDTPAGAQGANLSGGERQRVQIARLVLQDPPVIILDEATAALDPLSERIVQRWMASISGRSTIFVAAHRLHTIMSADRVVVLDGGRVVESGPPHELAIRDGYFARMRGAQTSISGWSHSEVPS